MVFLDVGLRGRAPRIGMDAPRPLLLDSPRATWTRLMEARRPMYTDVADLVVTTTELEPAGRRRRSSTPSTTWPGDL